ncbi:hypothetical protein ABIB35_003435 [Arthrobacter sp. UYP6]|uniref:hypothetical protein n=1 Tax=Arthrobacter sp. UYP6 TaxID=1756378 RepID=UPI003398BB23
MNKEQVNSEKVNKDKRARNLRRPPIDRKLLVSRHNVRQNSLDPASPVTVGNGEFAFTMDLTGLQSFPASYPVGEPGQEPAGTLLGTQSSWGWHSIPPAGAAPDLKDSLVEYPSPRGPVKYVDLNGGSQDQHSEATGAAEAWLRGNPHRLDLGRIGLSLHEGGSSRPPHAAEISGPEQCLDLWTGMVDSRFNLAGETVAVRTACHPDRDELAISVSSPLLSRGLGITVSFPYGSAQWHDAADFTRPQAHRTQVETVPGGWLVRRSLDKDGYVLRITCAAAELDVTDEHELRLRSTDGTLDASFLFLPVGEFLSTGETAGKPDDSTPAGAAGVLAASPAWWERFWCSGAAVQLAETPDPRALELERRIVLSQYLTAVNCAGSTPPQETGLVCNSWRGRFHLEMHWWHGAHFALWNRPELLERSMGWYSEIRDTAVETARSQGLSGARWPKQVAPDGRESPSTIGPFLIWQQPHPIYLAELLYRAAPSRALLEKYAEIITDTANFMAGFALPADGGYTLGPPLIPAQESYASLRARVSNPTFELAYWQWALQTASRWMQRMGREPDPRWTEVAAGMTAPLIREGVYAAMDVEPFTLREDHPSMLCALGFLPQTELIDPEVMRATLHDVLDDWDWKSTWGWDYAVAAMTAARLSEPETAVEALLRPEAKNTHLTNGHNRQTPALPVYLPGNGGLLSAVALMAAGWDNGPRTHAPGFPPSWTVQWEGLVRAP